MVHSEFGGILSTDPWGSSGAETVGDDTVLPDGLPVQDQHVFVKKRRDPQDCRVQTCPNQYLFSNSLSAPERTGVVVLGHRHRHDDHVGPLAQLH